MRLTAYSTHLLYQPLHGNKGLRDLGAGDILSSLLDVTIVALALPMFNFRCRLKRHVTLFHSIHSVHTNNLAAPNYHSSHNPCNNYILKRLPSSLQISRPIPAALPVLPLSLLNTLRSICLPPQISAVHPP